MEIVLKANPSLRAPVTSSKLVLGRGPLFHIKSTKCGREQVEVSLDGDLVAVKQLGKNLGSIGDTPMVQNAVYKLKVGDEFSLISSAPETTFIVQAASSSSSASTTPATLEPPRRVSKRKNAQQEENQKEEGDFANKKVATDETTTAAKPTTTAKAAAKTSPAPETTTTTTKGPLKTLAQSEVVEEDGVVIVRHGPLSSHLNLLLLCVSVKDPFFRGKFQQQIKQQANNNMVVFVVKEEMTEPTPQIVKSISAVFSELDIPYIAVVPRDQFHVLPMRATWNAFTRALDRKINIANCIVVGAEAGRTKLGKEERDKKATDRKFAHNIDMKMTFKTPQEYFENAPQRPFEMKGFDPRTFAPQPKNDDFKLKPSQKQEMIVSVGPVGCGKTSFTNVFTHGGYVHVNQDTLKTWQKCVALAQKAVSEGKSVIIDNTNPDTDSRARYINIAKAAKIPVRCMHFNISVAHASHNNQFRFLSTRGATALIPFIAYPFFQSKYVAPSLDEGFADIIQVYFHPHFESEQARELYMQVLT